MDAVRPVIHLVLHILVPGLVARLGWPAAWRRAWGVMVLTLLVDLDHLLANPVFDPGRCSIGFHPLHQPMVFPVYLLFCLVPRLRWVGAGLVIHMLLDAVDCVWMRWG